MITVMVINDNSQAARRLAGQAHQVEELSSARLVDALGNAQDLRWHLDVLPNGEPWKEDCILEDHPELLGADGPALTSHKDLSGCRL